MSVDHDHAWKKVKISTTKLPDLGVLGIWLSHAIYKGTDLTYYNPTRALAIKLLKQRLLRMSVRGLLCWQCNTGLQKWRDNPVNLERASRYLRNHNGGRPIATNKS